MPYTTVRGLITRGSSISLFNRPASSRHRIKLPRSYHQRRNQGQPRRSLDCRTGNIGFSKSGERHLTSGKCAHQVKSIDRSSGRLGRRDGDHCPSTAKRSPPPAPLYCSVLLNFVDIDAFAMEMHTTESKTIGDIG